MIPDHDRKDLRFADKMPQPLKAQVFNSTGRHVATLYDYERRHLQARSERFCEAIGRGFAEFPDE